MNLGSKRFLAIALFTALLIILVNFAWWLSYRRTAEMLEHQLNRRLISVTQSIAIAFPTQVLQGLINYDLAAYRHTVSRLETIRVADSLAEVFILNDRYEYLATTAIEPDTIYFLTALNGPYVDSLFFGFTYRVTATPTYRSGDLFLKSAFAPLFDDSGQVVAVLGVDANVDYFEDLITQRRNVVLTIVIAVAGGLGLGLLFLLLQQNLLKTERQLFLGQTHAYLGRMVAVVAHEIRNPLMIIRGSAERLKKKTDAEEASYILEETDRLGGIVSGYLDFAKAEGPLVANDALESFDLADLLRSAQRHFIDRFDGTPIEWMQQEPFGSVRMVGYRRSLRQVILNLLVNAAEACLAAQKPVVIGLWTQADGDMVTIEIEDCGPGLSKKEVKKLFTPFYTTKQTGSGLGLYLSRKLVSEMGGTITVRSDEGKGTIFAVEVPKEIRR